MTQKNVEIVRRAFDSYARGEVDFELIDPECIWNPFEEEASKGRDAIRAYLERWEGAWEELVTTGEEFVDAGDQVVVTVHFRGRGVESGVDVDARFFHVYTLRDGKTVRFDEYRELAEALEAVGLSE
jgi:ketosteroid isomerase-like protein